MSKIFRQVLCKDRNPKVNGTYNTDLGLQFYSHVSGWGFPYKGNWQKLQLPEYFFEVVELPSEEEMKSPKGYKIDTFSEGFNAAIKYLKGEK